MTIKVSNSTALVYEGHVWLDYKTTIQIIRESF